RAAGIEPAWPAWKAGALPLSHARGCIESSVRSAGNREEPPAVGHSFELMFAAVLEAQAGPGDDALHRLRDEHLAGTRHAPDPRGDVDGDAADVVPHDLDLAGVETDARLEAHALHAVHDRLAAPHRPARSVERREE